MAAVPVGKMDMFGSGARAEAGRALHADIVCVAGYAISYMMQN